MRREKIEGDGGRGGRKRLGEQPIAKKSSSHDFMPAATSTKHAITSTKHAAAMQPWVKPAQPFQRSHALSRLSGETMEDEEEEEQQHDPSDGEGFQSEGSGRTEDGEEEDRERSLLQQVADDVPFEVLEVLKHDGTGPVGQAARQAAKAAQERQFHRANRHRPSEMSSKRPVGRLREVIQITKRESVDPRFLRTGAPIASTCSNADRSYAFLYDEVIPEERKMLRARIQKERNLKFKSRLQAELAKLDQAQHGEQARRKRAQLLEGQKESEKRAVAGGKKPFYLKKSEQKRLELLAKYKELHESGGLEKYMQKRRRKNASKDHRYVPSERRGS